MRVERARRAAAVLGRCGLQGQVRPRAQEAGSLSPPRKSGKMQGGPAGGLLGIKNLARRGITSPSCSPRSTDHLPLSCPGKKKKKQEKPDVDSPTPTTIGAALPPPVPTGLSSCDCRGTVGLLCEAGARLDPSQQKFRAPTRYSMSRDQGARCSPSCFPSGRRPCVIPGHSLPLPPSVPPPDPDPHCDRQALPDEAPLHLTSGHEWLLREQVGERWRRLSWPSRDATLPNSLPRPPAALPLSPLPCPPGDPPDKQPAQAPSSDHLLASSAARLFPFFSLFPQWPWG